MKCIVFLLLLVPFYASAAATTTVALPVKDTTPPVRSGGFPSGTLSQGGLELVVSFVTDEPARCYWSVTPNTPFNEMSAPFSASRSGTSHSLMLWNVHRGDFAFFVKCRDALLNANTTDYPILFVIEYNDSNGDRVAPRVLMGYPTGGERPTEGFINLVAVASDNVGVSGVRFFLNKKDLEVEDAQKPYSVSVRLKAGKYTAFAVAKDAAGNRATSTTVAFSVAPKTTALSLFGVPFLASPLAALWGELLAPLLWIKQ